MMTFLACPHNFKGLRQGKDLILRLRLENGLILGLGLGSWGQG